jgi:ADP-heptose:LPS heptosyltransferase
LDRPDKAGPNPFSPRPSGSTEGVVGLNPSATFGPAKQWFPERYAALGDRLSRRADATIVIFGGPSDRELGHPSPE